MHKDAFVAIALIAAAIAAMVAVWPLQAESRAFPSAMAGLLLVGAVLLLGKAVLGRGSKQGNEGGTGILRLLLVGAATAAFAVAMPLLGFYPATFLYLAALYVWLSDLRAVPAIAVAAVLTITIYVLFGYFLAVPTPGGMAASLLHG